MSSCCFAKGSFARLVSLYLKLVPKLNKGSFARLVSLYLKLVNTKYIYHYL
jgi:hypothetical protein